jgi:hypothetical protein
LKIPLRPELLHLEKLWKGLTNSSERETLVEAAANSPLLQHRIATLAQRLGTHSAIKQTLETHAQDVSWHVQRLSRVRNAIVHGGSVPEDLTQLAAHLADYLWTILRDLLDELADPNGVRELRKYFEKGSYLYERVFQTLNESADNPLPYQVLINPRSIWPQGPSWRD